MAGGGGGGCLVLVSCDSVGGLFSLLSRVLVSDSFGCLEYRRLIGSQKEEALDEDLDEALESSTSLACIDELVDGDRIGPRGGLSSSLEFIELDEPLKSLFLIFSSGIPDILK